MAIKQGVKSAADNNIASMAPLISPDYSGFRNNSKKRFLADMKDMINEANILRIKIRHNFIQITGQKANSQMRITVFSQPESDLGSMNSMMFIELELKFEKRRDDWLLSSMEIVSLNDNPLS